MSCLSNLKELIKKSKLKIPEDRIQEYSKRLDNLKADSLSAAQFQEAAQKMLDEELALTLQKYRARDALELVKATEAVSAIKAKVMGNSTFDNIKNFAEGGQIYKGIGGNYSVKNIQATTYAILKQLFNRAVEQHLDVMESGALDKQIIQELFHQGEGNGEGKSGSKEAAQIAKGWLATQNAAFDIMSSMNPFLERTKEYIMKHMYSQEKVSKITKQEFVDLVMPNSKRSMPGITDQAKRQEIYENIYDRIKDGTYGTVQDDATAGDFLDYSKPTRDIMRSTARHRVIIFDSPDAYYEVNKQIGYGNMAETMEAVIRRASRNIAVLEKWGANPENTFNYLISQGLKNAKGEDLKDLKTRKLQLEKSFRQSVGMNDAPAQTTGAQLVQGAATLEYLAHGAASVPHSLVDMGISAQLQSGLNGKNIFENALEVVTKVSRLFPDPKERRKVLEDMALTSSTTNQAFLARLGSPENQPGLLGKIVSGFSKITGAKAWHESSKAAAAIMLGKNLAELSHLSFDELPRGPKSEMQRYKIDTHEWEYLRQAVSPWDGPLDSRMTPFKDLKFSNIDLIPDKFLEQMMSKKGIEPAGEDEEYTEKQKFLAKTQVKLHFGSMINDFAAFSAAEPGDRQNGFLKQGHDINDPMGMGLKLATQFKGPMLTTYDSFRRGFANGDTLRGAWSNVAQQAILQTFLFAVGDMALQLATGKEPDDPRSFEYALKAIAGSGGGGIFAEILANEMSKKDKQSMAYSGLKSLAGPTVSSLIEGGASFTQGVKAGTKHGLKAGLKEPVNWILSQTPGQNMPLLGTRGALGYYFTNGLKEFLGPGHLNAMMNGPDGTREHYFMMNPMQSKRWIR